MLFSQLKNMESSTGTLVQIQLNIPFLIHLLINVINQWSVLPMTQEKIKPKHNNIFDETMNLDDLDLLIVSQYERNFDKNG